MYLPKSLLTCAALCVPTILAVPFVQDGEASSQDQAAMMQEMMEQAAKFTQPGPEHEFLALLIGEFDVTAKLTMGGQTSPGESGTSKTEWQVDGRWLMSEWSGSLMGMEGRAFHVLGYDNLKQSYVWTGFTNFDTAMNHAEGDRTQDGDVLILYGTLDEYLTGEHDKMVKYLYRFEGDRDDAGRLTSVDSYVLEVHDLPIGETNTKVMEFTYTRKK